MVPQVGQRRWALPGSGRMRRNLHPGQMRGGVTSPSSTALRVPARAACPWSTGCTWRGMGPDTRSGHPYGPDPKASPVRSTCRRGCGKQGWRSRPLHVRPGAPTRGAAESARCRSRGRPPRADGRSRGPGAVHDRWRTGRGQFDSQRARHILRTVWTSSAPAGRATVGWAPTARWTGEGLAAVVAGPLEGGHVAPQGVAVGVPAPGRAEPLQGPVAVLGDREHVPALLTSFGASHRVTSEWFRVRANAVENPRAAIEIGRGNAKTGGSAGICPGKPTPAPGSSPWSGP